MRIVEVVPMKDHTLRIKCDDGRIGFFDVSPYLKSEAFEELHNIDEFLKIHNGKYFIEWECGADLSADTIDCYLKEIVPAHV